MINEPDPSIPPSLSSETPGPPSVAPLQPRDKVLSDAIAQTLQAPVETRAALFGRLVNEMEEFINSVTPDLPWTCTLYIGTDGSHIFRGGVGHSLVIDPEGRLWRARSYEDFETTYAITETTCTIETLTPLYHQMREYLPQAT